VVAAAIKVVVAELGVYCITQTMALLLVHTYQYLLDKADMVLDFEVKT
jgi:hypothetical protein